MDGKAIVMGILCVGMIFWGGCASKEESVTQDATKDLYKIDKIVHIACVGDSITEGYGAIGYPDALRKLLGPGYEVKNFGESGTTAMASGAYPYDSTSAFEQSTSYHPDVVIVMFGTNDACAGSWQDKEVFVGEYEALIENYLEMDSVPQVVLCTPIATANVPSEAYGIEPEAFEDIQAAITEIGEAHSLPVIDLYSETKGHLKWYQADGVHPNTAGATVIGQLIYNELINREIL